MEQVIYLKRSILGSIFLYFSASTIASPSDCAAVYVNATRNIALVQRQQTELSYFYNKHCEKNGEINQSSFDVGIEATIKRIPFNFSASSTDANTKMQEFCKIGSQQNFFSNASSDFRDEVVSASLNSFNQCVALENKGLLLTHEEQVPHSVLIYGKIESTVNATLDAIAYDPKAVSCKSTGFTSDGESMIIDGSKALKISKNFTINCTREPKTEDASTYYPRTVIGVSTSLGPYSVELIEDKLYGFNLASQAKANYDKVLQERDALLSQKMALENYAAGLQKRIDNASVAVAMLSVGEYSPPSTAYFQPREYCGHNVEQHARNVCGSRKPQIHPVGGYGGNKCGYQHYVITCLAQ